MKQNLSQVGFIVLLAVMASLLPNRAIAQAPDWSLQPQVFGNSMTFTGFVVIGNENRGDDTDLVAAFYND